MAIQQLTLPGEIVKKSNALARARWSVESIWEPRLVALLASQVRADDTDFHVYEIPIAALMRGREKRNGGGENGGRDFKEIEAAVDRVMSRVLTIKDEKGPGWTKYQVFSRCRYRPADHVLELGFHPELKPHYLNLQKHFAQWNLLEYLMLPSVYSQRLFEILKSWDDRPEVVLPVAELHEMLDTPPSFRANFKEFRRRVLEKAHKDIQTHTQLSFQWEPVKAGRSVGAIRFLFAPGRKKLVETEQKKLTEEKRQSARNKAFREALGCAQKKNGECVKQDNKKAVCTMCQHIRACEEFRKKRAESNPA